ncbi:MAG: hypothetical protein V9E87_12840 [Gemmatimonadales bacterium]
MIALTWRHVAQLVFPLAVVACAKPDAPPPPAPGGNWTLDAAAVDSLPVLTPADGRLVCIADGRAACPLLQPIANRLGGDRFALWEPGRLVQIWGTDTVPTTIGKVGKGLGEYEVVLGVGPGDGKSVQLIDMMTDGARVMTFDGAGAFVESKPLPPIEAGEARGFVGALPVLQGMVSKSESGEGAFRLFLLKKPTDTTGTLVLQAPMPWVRMQGTQLVSTPPLFATSPVYALFPDGEVAWGEGDRIDLIRKMADGNPRWQLHINRPRLRITPEEFAAKRASVQSMLGGQLAASDLDSMQAKSDTLHPALAGLLASQEGRLYLIGPITGADQIEYIQLSPDGKPSGRFHLPATTKVLLAAGDSLLVQRPQEGELREVRWLRLGTTP